MAAGSVKAVGPADYLAGIWKRQLEWKEFGNGFQSLRSSNVVVVVEEFSSSQKQDGVRFLKWSFGRSPSPRDLSFGYVMKLTRGGVESGGDDGGDHELDTHIEWQYSGRTCSGAFQPATRTFVLNFLLPTSTHVMTYRIVDDNTMAVCITEVGVDQNPAVQLGHMVRVDPKLYASVLQADADDPDGQDY